MRDFKLLKVNDPRLARPVTILGRTKVFPSFTPISIYYFALTYKHKGAKKVWMFNLNKNTNILHNVIYGYYNGYVQVKKEKYAFKEFLL